MKIYLIPLLLGSILFISSIYLWFRSGMVRKRNNAESKKDDRTGGYLFMSSIVVLVVALLFWLLI